MMVPVAFADTINLDILCLGLVCMLVYSVAGIHNAVKDDDYKLPSYYKTAIVIIAVAALLISFRHHIIFLSYLSWIGLGAFYNTVARFYLFGDVTLLSITHHTLPTVSSSLLLGLDFKTTMLLALFMFITFWFIIHSKNLKDTNEDRRRGYKTLTTEKKTGIVNTKLFFEISFLCVFVAYFIFGFSRMYLYALVGVLIVKIAITYLMDLKKHEHALNITRLMAILFLGAMIFDRSNNHTIILASVLIGFSYLVFMIIDLFPRRCAE